MGPWTGYSEPGFPHPGKSTSLHVHFMSDKAFSWTRTYSISLQENEKRHLLWMSLENSCKEFLAFEKGIWRDVKPVVYLRRGKEPESQSNHEKNIRQTQLRDNLQDTESVLLKAIKVIKKREV
ncbi:uncharacterized protein LOC144306403 [Canis aureus]